MSCHSPVSKMTCCCSLFPWK